jgi:hypothetical protein
MDFDVISINSRFLQKFFERIIKTRIECRTWKLYNIVLSILKKLNKLIKY